MFQGPAVIVSAGRVKSKPGSLRKHHQSRRLLQTAKIHEGGDASGSQVFPDEPLSAVPVETLC